MSRTAATSSRVTLLTRRRPHDDFTRFQTPGVTHVGGRRRRPWRAVVLITINLVVVLLFTSVLFTGNGVDPSAPRVRRGLWLPTVPQISLPHLPAMPWTDRSIPSKVLDLTNWRLTIPAPLGDGEEAGQIDQPQLATYQNPHWFHVDAGQRGVVFQAGVKGATTDNSKFPRSELREMNNGTEAAWNSERGSHIMRLNEAITHLPARRPEVTAAQIHDDKDDVVMIKLRGSTLFVARNDSEEPVGVLDANYVLGTPFDLEIAANAGGIRVTYNRTKVVNYKKTGDDWYFKAGCYTQSNTDEGEPKDAYGEVVIYSLSVQHSSVN